eukprot:13856461-Alexandrium_andersonii.AAC.1
MCQGRVRLILLPLGIAAGAGPIARKAHPREEGLVVELGAFRFLLRGVELAEHVRVFAPVDGASF